MSRKKPWRKTQAARVRRSEYIYVSTRSTGRGIKIVEGGKDGLFMSMPSRKTQDGYKDICFPVTEEFRNELKQAVLGAYGEALSMAQASTLQTAPPQNPGQNMV